MLYPQILLISSSSTLRRLYHQLLDSMEYELHTAPSISDALVQLAINECHVVIIESGLPLFEISLFLNIREKKKNWSNASLIVLGYDGQHHQFPKETIFLSSKEEVVSTLKSLSATL